MSILVLNSGSSSLKFKLFSLPSLALLASGAVEEIAIRDQGRFHIKWLQKGTWVEEDTCSQFEDHEAAIQAVAASLDRIIRLLPDGVVKAVGHRVVHGGERFLEPVVVNGEVIEALRELIPLAPLHNPANLKGIELAMSLMPDALQVAVFDTAFYHGLPPYSFLYGLPLWLYREAGIRRYGFHGTSHSYVASQAAAHLGGSVDRFKMITLHLGNGASAAAIDRGQCVDTSMGFTPLEGLIMGTRCGDLDPSVIFFLNRELGMSFESIEELLNRDSGLKGLCGESDVREILSMIQKGNNDASTALEAFCYRVKKYIGAYMAVLGELDCLVFTGGIGENSPEVRERCCDGLETFGIAIDKEANRSLKGQGVISGANRRVQVLVIPTDEEHGIAIQASKFLESKW